MHYSTGMGQTLRATAVVAISLLASASETLAFDEAAMIKLGESEFLSYCASCHGLTAHGDGPVAEVLIKKPVDLTKITSRYSGQFPTDAIQQIIDGRNMINPHGNQDMPVWGDRFFQSAVQRSRSVPHDVDAQALAVGRVAALVKYLESIQE